MAARCCSTKSREMDVRLQAKLLRAIQERLIDRVGGSKPVPVDIRILATSNRNLDEAVREGTFREDLLFRLNVVNLKLPPLRDRPGDIAALVRAFRRQIRQGQRPAAARAQPPRRATRCCARPGRAMCASWKIPCIAPCCCRRGDVIGADAILMPDGTGLLDVAARQFARGPGRPRPPTTMSRSLVGRTVADVEHDLILETLDHTLGNRTHAANILGISIRTLRNKLNQYADEGTFVPGPGEQRSVA